jgi:excisionase family DNA binding protein
MEPHLTPSQVARAIGVSDASLKRWCDKGLLPFSRTPGGHRRLPLRGVLAFLRRTGRHPVRPEVLGLPPTSGNGCLVISRAIERTYSALRDGDEQCLLRLIFDHYLAGHSAALICDRILAPAFERIGLQWYHGNLEIYQERRACEQTYCLLRRLKHLLPAPTADAPLAIGASPAGDSYMLPTIMASVVLQEAGWRAESLGIGLPIDALVRAMRELRPRLVWLSVAWVPDEARFLQDYEALFEAAGRQGAAVAVGGRWLTNERRNRMRYSTFCDTMHHLVAFADTLASNGNGHLTTAHASDSAESA